MDGRGRRREKWPALSFGNNHFVPKAAANCRLVIPSLSPSPQPAIRVPRVSDVCDAVASPPRESDSFGGKRRKTESVDNKEKCSISQSTLQLKCVHVPPQNFGCRSLQLLNIKSWNSLPKHVRQPDFFATFQFRFKTQEFKLADSLWANKHSDLLLF